MAFPATSVLDNFNRTNENPLSDGGNWTNPLLNGNSDCQVSSNVAAGTSTSNSAYRSNTTYGPDCECYVTLSTKSGNSLIAVYARVADPGLTTIDGYRCMVAIAGGTDNVRLMRVDNGTNTQLGADMAQEVAGGDSFGIEIIGSTVAAYYKASGGSWSQLGTRTDSTYSAAGNIGMILNGTGHRFDDFGGGTLSTTITRTATALAAAFSLVTPTRVMDTATRTATAISAAFSMPTVTRIMDTVTRAATAIAAAFSLITPTAVSGGITRIATAIAATFSIAAPTRVMDTTIRTATAVTAAFSIAIPARLMDTVSRTAATLSAAFSVVTPTVLSGIVRIATVIAAVFSMPDATRTMDTVMRITTPITAAFSIPNVAQSLALIRSATVLAANFTIITATRTMGTAVRIASALFASFSIRTPSHSGGGSVGGLTDYITRFIRRRKR